MKRTFFPAVIVAIPKLYPQVLFAWGHQGHSRVAEVAFSQLNESTRIEVIPFDQGIVRLSKTL